MKMAGFHSAQGECCDFAGPFCLRASSPWPLPRGRRLIGDPATAASVRLSSQRGSPGQGAEAPAWATRSPDDGAGTGRLSPWPGAPSASSSQQAPSHLPKGTPGWGGPEPDFAFGSLARRGPRCTQRNAHAASQAKSVPHASGQVGRSFLPSHLFRGRWDRIFRRVLKAFSRVKSSNDRDKR